VTEHGGTIAHEARAGGSCFRVTLPVSESDGPGTDR